MEARAVTKYIRIAPRKMRLVINQVRFKPVKRALDTLARLNKKAARLVEKTLKTAEANAKDLKMDESRLFVRDIRADGGPSLKRYMSRSMGRADVILKRSTHLRVVLGEREVRVQTPESTKETKPSKAESPKSVKKPRVQRKAVGASK